MLTCLGEMLGRATLGFAGHEEPDIPDQERIQALRHAVWKTPDDTRLAVLLRARLALSQCFVESYERIAIAAELRAIGEKSRAPVFLIGALVAGLGDSLQRGEGREWKVDQERLERASADFKQPYGFRMAGVFRAVKLHLAGRFDEANRVPAELTALDRALPLREN